MSGMAPVAGDTVQGWMLERIVGSGSFATVWLARRGAETAAVKVIATDRLSSKLKQSLESEVTILRKIDHPNIVRLLETVKVTHPFPPFRAELEIKSVDAIYQGSPRSSCCSSRKPGIQEMCQSQMQKQMCSPQQAFSLSLVHTCHKEECKPCMCNISDWEGRQIGATMLCLDPDSIFLCTLQRSACKAQPNTRYSVLHDFLQMHEWWVCQEATGASLDVSRSCIFGVWAIEGQDA